MSSSFDFGFLAEGYPLLLRGIGMTLALWLPALVIGLGLGLFVSQARMARHIVPRSFAIGFIEIFRDIPVLIQLVWFYYAFPMLIGLQMSPYAAALLGLSLNTAAFSSEIFRGGITSIERGQWEGARALGMPHSRILRRIILPQVFRRMLPALTNRAIELAKTTSLASVLAVSEIMYQGRMLSAMFYRPLEVFSVVAIIYFCIIYPGDWLSRRLEQRLARKS